MTALGARIRTERESRGMSQSALAQAAGVDRDTLAHLESGRTTDPRWSTVAQVAQVWGLEVVDLLVDGPPQCDLAFGLRPGLELGPLRTIETSFRTVLLDLLPRHRVESLGIWPWGETVDFTGMVLTTRSSVIRLRAPAAMVPALADLAEVDLGGRWAGVRLRAPVVRPVRPSGDLRVLVQAPTTEAAQTKILRRTTSAGCCPPIQISATSRRPLEDGVAWMAHVTGVPAISSAALQRPHIAGPEGIFVPA